MRRIKEPDMLINNDMKILQQILGMALSKGNGVSIPVFTINQVVINVTLNGDHRRAIVGGGKDAALLTEGKDPERSARAIEIWKKRKAEKDNL